MEARPAGSRPGPVGKGSSATGLRADPHPEARFTPLIVTHRRHPRACVSCHEGPRADHPVSTPQRRLVVQPVLTIDNRGQRGNNRAARSNLRWIVLGWTPDSVDQLGGHGAKFDVAPLGDRPQGREGRVRVTTPLGHHNPDRLIDH